MNSSCHALDRTARERVHYFPRQLITAEDMIDEQNFFLQKFRRHNRLLHGWGVVCGCRVEAAATSQYPWQVTISHGYLLDPLGNEVCLLEQYPFDIAAHWPPSAGPCVPPGSRQPRPEDRATDGKTAFLAVCYHQCDSRPVRVHPAGCGCDEADCEYSRLRDSFRVVVLPDMPEYQKKAAEADASWFKTVQKWVKSDAKTPPPAAPCPEAVEGDPCVVLAEITLPAAHGPLDSKAIDNDVRRVLFSAHSLEGLIRGMRT